MPLTGKPRDWVGKRFIHPQSGNVIEVTAYKRGGGGRWSVWYKLIRSRLPLTETGEEHHAYPRHFRHDYEPYDPERHGPITPEPGGLRLVPPNRKDVH